MDLNEDWFYHGTEGFLGKPEDCKVLFLLKEPDSSGNDVEEGSFWFQEVYQRKIPASKYLKPIQRIASLLLPNVEDSLSCAAYINLHPVKGGSYESENFKETLRQFRQGVNFFHRWDIIKAVPDSGFVVTTKNIYYAAYHAVSENLVTDCLMGEKSKTALSVAERILPSFTFQTGGKTVTFLSMYHPVYLSRNGWKASDIKLM